MKKRILFVSALLTLSVSTFGCVFEGPTHNYYLFSVLDPSANTYQNQGSINAFWKDYTHGLVGSYRDFAGDDETPRKILAYAQKKKDTEMVNYLRLLNSYLRVSDQITADSWDYPTKAQLLQRRQSIVRILRAAQSYRGSRLKSRYMLLAMRANMLLGNDAQNKVYWTTKGSKLPQSVYRDMMENIYARALLKTGQKQAATEIYARQGDVESLKWSVRNYRNLAGIQALYRQNPNSMLLPYLVQDFVNNAQETIDNYAAPADGQSGSQKDIEEWIKEVGCKPVYQQEVNNFIAFANQVVSEGKTTTPCLWQTAIGTLDYLFKDYDGAKTALTKALTLAGSDRMKDNARAVLLVNSTHTETLDGSYEDYLIREFRWLHDEYVKDMQPNTYGLPDNPGEHYEDILDRAVYANLYPRLIKEGRAQEALCLLAYMDEQYPDGRHTTTTKTAIRQNPPAAGYNWGRDWNTEYFTALDKLSADSLAAYVRYMDTTQNNAFAEFLRGGAYRDSNYFNDLIGTKYMAEGRFADAIPYLKQVDPKYLSSENISGYLTRDYTKPYWFDRQAPKMTNEDTNYDVKEGPGSGTFSENPKLQYCLDMTNLQSQYSLAKDEATRQPLAYELATRLYQASYEGDCWALTHYSWSIADSVRTGDMDFIKKAIGYLDESKLSEDENLAFDSYYALAAIRRDSWYKEDWSLPTPQYYDGHSRQYQALKELNNFLLSHPAFQDNRYVSHCDVLKKFREG
ncbi:MAG: hypothetical protein PUD15_00070 [Prevotella sp.]|nr:hypothetical protein [Prevotella sp.]